MLVFFLFLIFLASAADILDVSLEAFEAQIGHFSISWMKWDEPSLVVSVGDEIAWQTSPGEPFVGVYTSQDVFHDIAGNIQQINGKDVWHSSTQSLEKYTISANTLTVYGNISLNDEKLNYSLSLSQTDLNSQLELSLQVQPGNETSFNRIWISYKAFSDEHVYGLGEQFSFLNLKGSKVPMIVREQGVGRGLEPLTSELNAGGYFMGGSSSTTYAPIPFYLTSKRQSLFLLCYSFSEFDFTVSNRTTLRVSATSFSARIIHGNSLLDILESYTALSGRMEPLPEWITNGSVVGMEGGLETIEPLIASLVKFQVPVSAIWLQDWSGGRVFTDFARKGVVWNWEFDNTTYPDFPDFIKEMKEKGVKVLGYVNPMFIDAKKFPSKTYQRNLYEEVIQNGYAALQVDAKGNESIYRYNNDGIVMLDLYNQKAYEWMQSVIRQNLLDIGLSGYMCDFGESYPLTAPLEGQLDFSKASAQHNQYPEQWAKLNREVTDSHKASTGEDIIFFTRSAFSFTQKYSTLGWLGDQLTTFDKFDGMQSAVKGMLSGGLSGVSLSHSDIGGYTTIVNQSGVDPITRSKTLFLRWCELSVFSALFRTHPGSFPGADWQFYSDTETLSFFSFFSKLFASWSEYRSIVMQEAYQKGYPFARPLFLHYGDDPVTWTLDAQYMVGSEWIFAPVMQDGVSTVKVYLPEEKGGWIHLWSSTVVKAPGFVECSAPIGQPCLFFASWSKHGKRLKEKIQRFKYSSIE